MAAETDNQEPIKFTFEGKKYDLPTLIECDMDEWMLVYEYAKVTIKDTVPCEDPADEQARVDKLSQPGTWFALFHIAYRRANPKRTDAAIKALVGKIDYLEALAEIAEQMPDEDEDENPTSAITPETLSSESSDSSSKSSSLVSLPSSETPADQPAPTGTTG